MTILEDQAPPVTATSESELHKALLELRALDEMERLALKQAAAARQRKRELLLKNCIPTPERMAPKILVMRSAATSTL